MENVRVYSELEERVTDRTAELQARTDELEETNRTIRLLYDETSESFEALRERNAHHLQVLRTLAHEVRSPLAAAQGMLRLTLREAEPTLEPTTVTDLGDVDGAITEAIETVSRQLESARAEAGAVAVRIEDIDLRHELLGLRAMFRALTRSDAVTLVVEEPTAGLTLRSDRALLGHILRNLVGNALKFTDSGEVRVRASAVDGAVQITVCDTGIGIAPQDIERVFGEWEQVGDAQPQRPEGSGLGLALVRRLVTALGAEVALQSEVGRGSTFILRLPQQP
jgi:signal transduction histidine kinase